MCGCFALALGAFFPRITVLLLWIFTDWVQRAFSGEWILPLVGIVLLPYTTLTYILLFQFLGEVEGFSWFVVALAFIVDLGSWVGSARGGRSYQQQA
jgi:hypothetical protein